MQNYNLRFKIPSFAFNFELQEALPRLLALARARESPLVALFYLYKHLGQTFVNINYTLSRLRLARGTAIKLGLHKELSLW